MDRSLSRKISYNVHDSLLEACSKGLLIEHKFDDGRDYTSWPDSETVLMSVNATQDSDRLTEFMKKFAGNTYIYGENRGVSIQRAKISYPHGSPSQSIPMPHPSMTDVELLRYQWPNATLSGAYEAVLYVDIGVEDSLFEETEAGDYDDIPINNSLWVPLHKLPIPIGSNRCNMCVIRSYLDDPVWGVRAKYILENLTRCETDLPDGYIIVKNKIKKVNIVDRLQMNIPYTMKIEKSSIIGGSISEIRSLDRDAGIIGTHNVFLRSEKEAQIPNGVDKDLYAFYKAILCMTLDRNDKTGSNVYDVVAGTGAMMMPEADIKDHFSLYTDTVSSFVSNDTEVMRILSLTFKARLVQSKKDAEVFAEKNMLSDKKGKTVQQVFLPHCKTLASKVRFLAIMTIDVIFVLLSRTEYTDLKDFIYKRWDTFGHRERDYIRSMLQRNNTISNLSNNMDSLISVLGQNKWPNAYKSYKSYKGKGGAKEEDLATAIVNDALTYNNASILDSIRMVKIGASSTGNTAATRRVHTSQYNLQCPANTPENENIGLNNSLSEVVLISEDLTEEERSTLADIVYSTKYSNGDILLMFDGEPVMFVNEQLYWDLQEYKFDGIINRGIGIAMNKMWEHMPLKVITVRVSHGRPLQPVLIVPESMHIDDLLDMSSKPWNELVDDRRVILLDAYEVSFNCIIAEWIDTAVTHVDEDGIVYFNNAYTHMHIIPGGMLSQATNCLSYLEHNPAARGTYATLHIKQSISHPFLYPEDRFDHESNVICNPEPPLVSTRTARRIGMTGHKSPYIPQNNRSKPGFGKNANTAFFSDFGNYDDASHISERFAKEGGLSGYHYDIFNSDQNISVGNGVNNTYNVIIRQTKTMTDTLEYREIRGADGVGLIDPDFSDSVILPYAHPTTIEIEKLTDPLDLSIVDDRLSGMKLYELEEGLLYARFGFKFPTTYLYKDNKTGEITSKEYTDISLTTIPGCTIIERKREKDRIIHIMALVAIREDKIDTYDTTFLTDDPLVYEDKEWYISRDDMVVPKATVGAKGIGRTVAIMKKRVIKRGDVAIILVERTKDAIIGLKKERFSATFGTIEKIQRGVNTRIRVAMPIGPEPGNKYASLHAQKNVCGRILPPEETPIARWTNTVTGEEEEMNIDIVFNPLGIPSRMTMGMEYEVYITGTIKYLAEKYYEDIGMSLYDLYLTDRDQFDSDMSEIYGVSDASELLDELCDSTPFVYDNLHKKEKCKSLRIALGIPDEAMYDMYYPNGDKMGGKVYCGTIYYVKLRHLVDNKRRARGYVGKRDPVTGQPVKGRRKDGGSNTGTMEADVYKSHGARAMLYERMNKVTDGRVVHKCSLCGGLVSKTGTKSTGFNYKCIDCDTTLLPQAVYEVNTVQSWELFRYYMRGLGLEISETFE